MNLELWREALRLKLSEILGITSYSIHDLEPRSLATFRMGEVIVEKVDYVVERGLRVPAYLLIPENVKKPTPAIIALHGHGSGKDDLLGFSKREGDRKGHSQGFVMKLAERGFVVLAPDARGFGEMAVEGGCWTHSVVGLLLGRPIAGMRLWDDMRSLDYLLSREEVDA
jgi:cephalosporin-C deacetylase-like acetyl esterase